MNVLAGAYYIPNDHPMVKRVKKDLTFAVKGAGFDPKVDEPVIVKAWAEDRSGFIGVPRQYGLTTFTGEEYDDTTSAGYELGPSTPIVLREYQEPWVADVVRKLEKDRDTIAMAATGKGKGIMSLEIAVRLGATTLVVVDQDNLRRQWVANVKQFLGYDDSQIGIVQGSRRDYEGKDIVIAMIQTLHSRKLDPEFYDYFGFVTVDESHTAGAPVFSRSLLRINAMYRLGVSATPDRRDVLDKVLKYNLGEVGVSLDAKHIRSKVRYLEHSGVVSWYANISPKAGRYINEIADDGLRNLKLAKAIVWLYESGRDTLALTDRIEHGESIVALCISLGVPEEDIGMLAGYNHHWGYAKDPKPPRKPAWLPRGCTEYTPVSLQMIKKRMKAEAEAEVMGKKVIVSTYGKFAKGVDVPRLCGGVELTPRGQARQVHGRILRVLPGKLIPIWVTMRDKFSFRAEFQFSQRIAEYVKSNAEVYKWDMRQGVRKVEPRKLKALVKQRAAMLRDCEITTRHDGSNIVLTPIIEAK